MLITRSRWRLGTCLPPGFLDSGGYIGKHQKGLTHISLVTDGSCPHSGGSLGGLRSLLSVKSLEWVGVQQTSEFDTLRACILRNRTHLAALSIGFITPLAAIDLYQDIFGLPLVEAKPSDNFDIAPIDFPCLTSLVLSKAPLPRKLRPKDASIFGSLQSLTLRDCASQITFLGSFSLSQSTMRLVNFEFCYDSVLHDHDEAPDVSPLVDFLLSLEGLKNLHLKLSNFSNTSQVQLAILKHLPTLESLAYHERGLLAIDDEGLFEDVRDKTPVWLSDIPWIANLYHATALALCTKPSTLVSSVFLSVEFLLTEAASTTRAHGQGFKSTGSTFQV